MIRPLRYTALALAVSALLAGAGWNAHAAVPSPSGPAATTLSVGPVTLGNVALRVCVAGNCQSTPAVTSAALDLAATAPPTATTTIPAATATLTESPCAAGTGLGATATGPAGASVTGSLTLVLAGGTRVALPVKQAIPATGSLAITACTA